MKYDEFEHGLRVAGWNPEPGNLDGLYEFWKSLFPVIAELEEELESTKEELWDVTEALETSNDELRHALEQMENTDELGGPL